MVNIRKKEERRAAIRASIWRDLNSGLVHKDGGNELLLEKTNIELSRKFGPALPVYASAAGTMYVRTGGGFARLSRVYESGDKCAFHYCGFNVFWRGRLRIKAWSKPQGQEVLSHG